MPSPPPPYSPNPSQPSINQTVRGSPAMSNNPFGASHGRSASGQAGEPSRGSPSSAGAYDQYRASPVIAQHQSPVPAQAPSFPPPPPRNGRDRSSSRPKDRQHSLFSFSALTSRHRSGESSNQQQQQQPQPQQPQATAIDSLRQNTSDVLSRAPGPSAVPATPTHM
jgi:hypothetical protein